MHLELMRLFAITYKWGKLLLQPLLPYKVVKCDSQSRMEGPILHCARHRRLKQLRVPHHNREYTTVISITPISP